MSNKTTENDRQITDLDPSSLIIGANVRTEARMDRGLVASIRERGVIEPIIAFRTEHGEVTVLCGQRRTLAAIEAKRATVPVLVVPSKDEADRLIDQMAENDHRASLTQAEQAQAFAALEGLGLSAAQIAKRTATKRQTVTAGIAVAKSENATAAIHARPELTLEEAALFAEFEDDEKANERLSAALVNGWGLAHVAQNIRDAREREAAILAAAAEAEAAGLTVIEDPGYSHPTIASIGRLKNGKKELTTENHAECPGAAVWVDARYGYDTDNGGDRTLTTHLIHVCTDWRANGHHNLYAGNSTPKKAAADMSPEERQKAAAERRDVIESNKQWDSAEAVRREWVRMFLTRKTAPKGSPAFLAETLNSHAGLVSDHRAQNLVNTFLPGADDTRAKRTKRIAAATEGRASVIALAHCLAAHEQATGRHSWRTVDAGTALYLRYLQANGYDLSPVEKRAAGITK